MLDEVVSWVRLGATLVAIFSLFCRLNAMSRTTPRLIAWQHEQLACALVMSLVLPPAVGNAVASLGVAAYLLMGAARWRHGPPYEKGPT